MAKTVTVGLRRYKERFGANAVFVHATVADNCAADARNFAYVEEKCVTLRKKQATMKTEEKKTRAVRSYSKKELALAYAPELTTGGAVKRLGVWMRYNPQLWQELQKRGYRTRQKLFTPQQVDVIFQYLGEP